MRNKKLIFLLLFSCLHLSAKVQVEKIYLQKKLVAYAISTKFFKTVLAIPGEQKSKSRAMNVVCGLQSIILKNSVGLLGKGIAPDGTTYYGFSQVFEPIVDLSKGAGRVVLLGIGKGEIDDKGELQVREFYSWHSSVSREGRDKENLKISFLQRCDKGKKALGYKMRIDYTFSDTALIEIKVTFLNLTEKVLRVRVSPRTIFKNSNSKFAPWIVVPYQRSRHIKEKRLNYIDCSPILLKGLKNSYEFTRQRLSRAKRWIAVGGLEQKGIFAFLSKEPIRKVVFWKKADCFSVYPSFDIEAKPRESRKLTWKIIVGRGMKTIRNISEQGLLGFEVKKRGKTKRYGCNIQFLPIKPSKDMLMELLLKSSRGYFLLTKTYETFVSSPLKPELVKLKLPKKVVEKERYLLKVEMLKNGNAFFSMEEWMFPN
jgi:hypothetical protein